MLKPKLRRSVLDPHRGFTDEDVPQVTRKVAALFRQLHEVLGVNLNDPNSKETPERAAKAYVNEFFGGLNVDKFPKMTVFPNTRKINEIVLLTIDHFESHCSHHWAPFMGCAWVGYIPADKVLGASKFSRLFDFFAARPQIQENLTSDVADCLEDLLKPKGLGVVVEATHTCMSGRGVKKHGKMMTAAMRGVFMSKPAARKEFYDLITIARN